MYRLPKVRVQVVREGSVAAQTRALRGPQDAAAILREIIGDSDRETFCVLLLDGKHRVAGVHVASIGLVDHAPVHPRETFRAAILSGAVAVIVGHNHPSGDPTPSKTDIMITTRLCRAADVIGIKLLDHVVIGAGDTFVSLAQRGDLPRDNGAWQP